MAKNKDTISPEQAHDELQKILGFRYADDAAFQRANYCMRVLGCPISDTGKYRVNEAQDGDSALELWDGYEFEREKLAEIRADWLEMQDDD